jgi:hypothetical protein
VTVARIRTPFEASATAREHLALERALEISAKWRELGRRIRPTAAALGIKTAAVSSALALAREYWAQQVGMAYGAAVAEELALLEQVERTAIDDHASWVERGRPDREQASRYLDTIIKVSERRAALLGLDAPKRLEVEVVRSIGDPDWQAKHEGELLPEDLELLQGALEALLAGGTAVKQVAAAVERETES